MLPWGWSVVDAVVEAQWRTHAGIAQAWQLAGGRAMVNANAVLDSRSFPSRPLWPGDVPDVPIAAVADPESDPVATPRSSLAASAVAGMAASGGATHAAPPGMQRGARGLAAGWHEPLPGLVARPPSQAASAPAQAAAGLADVRQAVGAGLEAEPVAFAALSAPAGFYPVVPDADWALRLLDWGVRTLQLRIKNLRGAQLAAAIARVSKAAAQAGAQLFINDHWREAIDAGAFGVHLGQEDLHGADFTALRAAGMRLGVSTHAPGELARAHALRPSYIALGPVYPTTLKVMPYQPLGLERLRDWTARCKPRYPTVAIGGISLQRAAAVLGCGVDGVAVVSAVTQAADPQAATREGLRLATQALQCRADFSA
ncbi:MAG: thiamine phosphate synthase [Betaproteobacteria bacterium]|nr:thiamine phosphate synthase [Betaproteobacteria bacterium]MDE2124577.1 thiamine phosphate synthase [Betaproteobacteria bacterium]MDE2187424.1 thiamine phosphate synthase [Betaproteobacteria bacterium]